MAFQESSGIISTGQDAQGFIDAIAWESTTEDMDDSGPGDLSHPFGQQPLSIISKPANEGHLTQHPEEIKALKSNPACPIASESPRGTSQPKLLNASSTKSQSRFQPILAQTSVQVSNLDLVGNAPIYQESPMSGSRMMDISHYLLDNLDDAFPQQHVGSVGCEGLYSRSPISWASLSPVGSRFSSPRAPDDEIPSLATEYSTQSYITLADELVIQNLSAAAASQLITPENSEGRLSNFGSSSHRSSSEGESAKDHYIYKNVSKHADNLFHCPWEGQPDCNHKPNEFKYIYDKFVDSHLKPYRCKHEGCQNTRFSTTACLLRHEREAHSIPGHLEKPYLCVYEGCERSIPGHGFPRQWNLRDHMRRVHNDIGTTNTSIPTPPPSGGVSLANSNGKKRQKNDQDKSSTDKPSPSRSISTPAGAEDSNILPILTVKTQPILAEVGQWYEHCNALQSIVQTFSQAEDRKFLQSYNDALNHLVSMGRISNNLIARKAGDILQGPDPRSWKQTAAGNDDISTAPAITSPLHSTALTRKERESAPGNPFEKSLPRDGSSDLLQEEHMDSPSICFEESREVLYKRKANTPPATLEKVTTTQEAVVTQRQSQQMKPQMADVPCRLESMTETIPPGSEGENQSAEMVALAQETIILNSIYGWQDGSTCSSERPKDDMSYTVAGKETHIDFTEATINEDSSSHDTHTMTDDRNHPDGSNSPPIRGCISPLESFGLAILHRGTPSASMAPSSQATESSGSPWDSEMLSISDSPPEFNSAKGSNMNLLMSILRILIVEFYATKRGNNAPTTPQAPITSSTTGSSTSNDSSSLASKKRPSGSDEDSNGSSEDKLAPSSKKRPRLTDARKRFLACPFWKRHRDSHFRCSKLALNRIRDVKQHLNRRHYQEFHCPRCFTIFEEEQALDSHIRGQIVCQPSSGRLDGMSHHQHRTLCKKSKPNQSAEEQWFVIWDILFLGHERPESAYVDPEFSEDFHEFQRFTQRRGPELLENLLNMNGVWSMPERDRQLQLRGILAQGFDAIREDWMTTPSPGPSYSALSTQPVENSHHGSNPALAVPSPSISMVDDRAGSQSEKNTDGLDGERQLPRLMSQGIQTVTESLAALDVLPEQELYRCLVNDLDPNFIDNEVSSAELNSEVQLGSRASMPGFIYDQTFLEAGLETVFNQYIENSVGVCMD